MSNAQDISYDDKKFTTNDSLVMGISYGFGNTDNHLGFDSGFKNDYIVVKVKRETIYEGFITTDLSLGAARGVQFDKKTRKIKIYINDRKLKIKNKKDYRFIYIDKVGDNYKILYRKAPIVFF